MEFKSYNKINALKNIQMTITQKIHGTNAQIVIEKRLNRCDHPSSPCDNPNIFEVDGELFLLMVGSRTRWIYPGDDNYGFAEFVYKNKEEFIRKLGVGQHFGEWAGPGINSGEGLSQKTFVLFAYWACPPERILPPQTVCVPVLYQGPVDINQIEVVKKDLIANGSKLVPGFMNPEGIVVTMLGERFKSVFKDEETQWKKPDAKYQKEKVDKSALALELYGHLLQPVRMEKLLSKDERLIKTFPESIKEICDLYMKDLIDEGQVTSDEGQLKAVRKALGGELFKFAKEMVTNQQNMEN